MRWDREHQVHTADTSSQVMPLPAAWAVVALSPEVTEAAVRLCVVVRQQRDPIDGYFVSVRRTFDAQVVLACITDAAGRIRQWLELWIQQPPEVKDTVGENGDAMPNTVLDQRWGRQAQAWRVADEAGTVVIGWESRHPSPTWVDPTASKVVQGVDAKSGHALALCQDDRLLTEHGLPAYSTSRHRYLYVPQLGEQSTLVPMTDHAPTNQHTQSIAEIVAWERDDLVPLNPSGGLMMARVYSPIGVESFCDLLAGQHRVTLRHGVWRMGLEDDPQDPTATWGIEANGQGRLFLERHGIWGRVLEGYHLKIKLLADAVAAVQKVTRITERPVLNLSPDSFQVRLGAGGCGLPYLWTARLVLADGGDAVALPVDTQVGRFYRRFNREVSIYQPRSAKLPTRGVAAVRIRNVETTANGRLVVEGTLATDERIETQPGDLTRLRLGIGGQMVDLYVRLDTSQALAVGEWRFQATNQRLDADQVQDLVAAKGVPLPETLFETVPHLSTPCDLYALAVLALRVLCVDQTTSLPTALDEVLSLARQIAQEHDVSIPLEQRIACIFDQDPRWLTSLGPHRLVAQAMSPEDAFNTLPAQIWWQTLAAVIRMLPGIGPDSSCRGWGDAPSGQIHKVFDRTLASLEALLQDSRSLIVTDWQFNREIHVVVRTCLARLTDR